jgi:hypothetical protein
MDLTVLAVPDCPNVKLLEERLAQVLEGHREVTVGRQVIADQNEAARMGMHGSPTILVDGIDPFAEPGQPASVSCRLYRNGNGQVDGAPSVSRLRQAISGAAATAADAGTPSWLENLPEPRGRLSCDEWRSHYKRRWPAGFAAAALRPARRPENTQSARDSPLT